MKQFIKQFCLRGLLAMGFGPVVMAIIFAILEGCGVVQTLSVLEVVRGVLSVTLMAFVAAGMTAIYQSERIGLPFAILLHALVLYLDYVTVYLINGWIAKELDAFLIFTACFIGGFALIWIVIYLCQRGNTDKLNKKLGQ